MIVKKASGKGIGDMFCMSCEQKKPLLTWIGRVARTTYKRLLWLLPVDINVRHMKSPNGACFDRFNEPCS